MNHVKPMSGLDILLKEVLEKTVRENLGKKTMQKIEQRLFERFGTSVTLAFSDFYKIDSVLREFFGAGTDGLEKKFLDGIISIEKTKNKDYEWIKIEDPHLNEIILESFGDSDKKAIMNAILDKPSIVSDILKLCKIPQTSGYRKINSLIKSGLLIPAGIVTGNDGKKITKYTTLFENVKINIEKNKVVIKVQLRKKPFNESSIIQVVKNL